MTRMHLRIAAGLLAATSLTAITAPAAAQANAAGQIEVNIPAGDLAKSLQRFARQSRTQVIFSAADLRGRRTQGARGRMTPAEALQQLVAGSGAALVQDSSGAFLVRLQAEPGNAGAAETAASKGSEADSGTKVSVKDIIITGSRIRGAVTASETITIDAKAIKEEGFTNLGEVIRSIPQNYSGGQNPGVTNGASSGSGQSANQNITGGSSLNLRGLGPDATLTLLNGRRMSYGGFVQIVDISAIPVAAVSRIEIVPDGASAIYGSDAVGGVANVVLKRDYEGVTVGARYGGATNGGLATREFTATAGTTWSTGGFIATYQDTHNNPIYADQRKYTQSMYDPATLYPSGSLHSGLLSIHQSIGNAVELHLDALRTERQTRMLMSYSAYYYDYMAKTNVTLISPSIDISLPNDWKLTLGGTYGEDETHQYQPVVTTATGIITSSSRYCYCNKSHAYEIGAEGPLFALPGGDARLAVGAGYRYNSFFEKNVDSGALYADGHESSRFAYGEINLPLIGPGSNVSAIKRLTLTAAVRGEDYDNFGSVATPKLGLIYDPSDDFTFRASWGKSFKAPTLLQQYSIRNVALFRPSLFGGTGYATDATVLWRSGGNPDLKPERSGTWSASLAFHPKRLPGLQAELTWFDIDYSNRVVQPIGNGYAQTLTNPIYAEFVDFSPTAAAQADVIASSDVFSNYTGAAYDPSKVIAVASDRFINATRQRVKGLDLSGSYRIDLGSGRLTVRGSVSWLDSTQQLTSAQSPYDVAGILFNPPKISGRLGAVWSSDRFSISTFANYKGGVTNTTDNVKSASFTTFDAAMYYNTGKRDDLLSGLTFELSAQNLFDQAPPLYSQASPSTAPYDSTNYSAVGRFISFSVSKHF